MRTKLYKNFGQQFSDQKVSEEVDYFADQVQE